MLSGTMLKINENRQMMMEFN